MAGDIPGFNETRAFFENYISDSTINYIIIAIFLLLLYDALRIKERIYYFLDLLKRLMIHFYNEDDKAFVNARANFVEGLLDEIKSLNLKSNWNDFNYTELEAEVEVSQFNELDGTNSKKLAVLFLTFKEMVIKRLKPSSKNKVEKSLIKAILKSKLNFFLVLGDPGSGKTVSLRKLFRILAKKCIDSKDKNTVVPIYVNLKNLNIEPSEISPDKIHSWIVEQICTGQHRDVNDFITNKFDQMLKDGHLFFLFDSFDEIPAIMRAKENDDIIWQYSSSINRFLKTHNKCKGVISSRHYRSPKGIIGQKIVIRSLPMKKIKDALFKYLGTDRRLATDLWVTLNQNQNQNILAVVQNPFYLGLLAQYVKDKEAIPETNYALFEHFICQRATYDQERIRGFDFSTEELIKKASILSYAITKSSDVGLDVELGKLKEILKSFKETEDWSPEHCESLINALTYSKFGQLLKGTNELSKKFSFVHRRFHEFFCALYIKNNLSNIPTMTLIQEDQWRETFVLLCEVLRFEDLTPIINYSRDCLSTGVNCKIDAGEYTEAGEAVRFLKDGFHNRIDLIPEDIKEKCSEFLKMQIEHKNILQIRNCIEGIILVDTKSAGFIFYSAFGINSDWIKDNILESCKLLSSMPKEISKSIKLYLYEQYSKNKM